MHVKHHLLPLKTLFYPRILQFSRRHRSQVSNCQFGSFCRGSSPPRPVDVTSLLDTNVAVDVLTFTA